MAYPIETVNLTKVFRRQRSFSRFILHLFKKPDEVLAIDKVNIRIAKGQILGLVGPNGAGKTTLIKILASLIIPTEGKVLVNGSVGLVTGEDRSLHWRLTGRQNLEFFASLYGISSKDTYTRIKDLTRLLAIDGLLDVTFQEYSTGAKQRLSVVRSLLSDPEILLFDEPTKSLDPSCAQSIREFIKSELVKQRKKTVLFATHNLKEATYLTEQLVLMENGRIKSYDNTYAESYSLY